MSANLLRATGTVLRVEEKSGTYVDREGRTQPWGFTNVRLLVGEADMLDVTFDAQRGPKPPSVRGELVDLAVKVSLRRGKGDFGPSINIECIGEWEAA